MGQPGDSAILCFATQGSAHLDAARLRHLLEPLGPEEFEFSRERRLRSAVALLRRARRRRPALIVMEGTGLAGGLAVMLAQATLRIPFVVSSGDAIGPYLALRSRLAGRLGGVYERLLCRRCAGYVGWTPYLAGRAITFGAPRAMTAPGWTAAKPRPGARERVRSRLGVDPQSLLIGLAGSLNWRARVGYAYGAELVQAVVAVDRADVAVVILGDGSGRRRLEALAGADLGGRILLPGRVPPDDVADYLAACDLASLPQSADGVGSFRYSIKLSEYLAAGLPVITGQIPAAYDLDRGFLWRLPGDAPWSAEYLEALTALLASISRDEIERRSRAAAAFGGDLFDAEAQQRRMQGFITDVVARTARGGGAPSRSS